MKDLAFDASSVAKHFKILIVSQLVPAKTECSPALWVCLVMSFRHQNIVFKGKQNFTDHHLGFKGQESEGNMHSLKKMKPGKNMMTHDLAKEERGWRWICMPKLGHENVFWSVLGCVTFVLFCLDFTASCHTTSPKKWPVKRVFVQLCRLEGVGAVVTGVGFQSLALALGLL